MGSDESHLIFPAASVVRGKVTNWDSRVHKPQLSKRQPKRNRTEFSFCLPASVGKVLPLGQTGSPGRADLNLWPAVYVHMTAFAGRSWRFVSYTPAATWPLQVKKQCVDQCKHTCTKRTVVLFSLVTVQSRPAVIPEPASLRVLPQPLGHLRRHQQLVMIRSNEIIFYWPVLSRRFALDRTSVLHVNSCCCCCF